MMRTLIADDSRIARRVLARTLKSLGYPEPEEATDGFEALELVKREPPFELILVDMVMPGMDAVELIRKLRSERNARQCAIVVVASETDPEVVLSAVRAGAQGYITKPFQPALIHRRLCYARQLADLVVRDRERERRTPASAGASLEGSVGDLSLLELFQFLSVQAKTGELLLESPEMEAQVSIRDGSIRAALAKPLPGGEVLAGRAALDRIVMLEQGRFCLAGPDELDDRAMAIDEPTMPLLFELARQRDEGFGNRSPGWNAR